MPTDRTYEALSGLRDALPLLEDALVPGTPRRWAQRDLTDTERARLDELARSERDAKASTLARGLAVLGDSKAPIRIDVLDATADIVSAVAELEDAVCDRLAITPLQHATTAERITRIIGLLDRIAAQDDLADHVYTEAVRLHRAASRALGDTPPMHRLDARCPICDARSLRSLPEQELVVCVNAACRCGDETCPCRSPRPRRHRWFSSQWPWLAQVLADELESA